MTTAYRALIAEDEPILAAALKQALQRVWPELHIAGEAANGIEAVQQALAMRPDIIFLDIKMPGKTGLEAAHELAEDWDGDAPFPLIVFVTAYDEYAVAAFEHAAADYLLKPINDLRLAQSAARLKERLKERLERKQQAQNASHDELEQLVVQLRSLVPQQHSTAERLTMIRAAVGNQVRMIPVGDVLYFEATDKYVNVVTAESEALIRTSLKELLPQLDPQQFWQIHRGTIVNAPCVLSAVRDEAGRLSLKLRGHSQTLRVSPLYAHLFRQM